MHLATNACDPIFGTKELAGALAAGCYTRQGGRMHFLQKIKVLMGLDFADRAHREIEQEEEDAARKAAVRYSRGSVGIQRNAFQTRKELDRQLERVGLPPTDRNRDR